ncbi:MAG: helix-turn-helix domain-containing protein [Gaiellaceae bacterium]
MLVWPIRRLALRLYRPYIEAADAAVASTAPERPLRDVDWLPGPDAVAESVGVPRSRALGTLIREYREFAGYSRSGLGELLGISLLQIERWEITGVRLPPSGRFLNLADFLDVPPYAIDAALAQGDEAAVRRLPRDRPEEEYGAVPALEYAIEFHGWTPEEIAEALDKTPTSVQAWRLGSIEMAPAERLALMALVRLRSERAAE